MVTYKNISEANVLTIIFRDALRQRIAKSIRVSYLLERKVPFVYGMSVNAPCVTDSKVLLINVLFHHFNGKKNLNIVNLNPLFQVMKVLSNVCVWIHPRSSFVLVQQMVILKSGILTGKLAQFSLRNIQGQVSLKTFLVKE